MAIQRVYAPRLYRHVTITSGATSADANDANDVIFDKTLIPLAGFRNGEPFVLNDIIFVDPAAQAAAVVTFFFFSANITTFGTADAAPSISDGDAATLVARVPFAATDITVTTNNTIGAKHNLNIVVTPVAATTSLYVAMTSAGTPNHAGATLTCRFGFLQ
jgi:hypothetical protein